MTARAGRDPSRNMVFMNLEMRITSIQNPRNGNLEHPLEGIIRAIRGLLGLPLLAVGSGGSFTVAHVASALHTSYTKRIAQAMTPLQLIASPVELRDLA